MKNIKWFFPKTLRDAEKLLHNGYRPHAGGTFLVKTGLSISGLFDLTLINEFHVMEDSVKNISIGSAVTYAEAASYIETLSPGNIFTDSLDSAAATPLRNRITLGGSIFSSPKWSDLIGPLIACDVGIELTGEKSPVEIIDYLDDSNLRKSSLIKNILIPKSNINGGYYRFTLTGFDYPFFTISVSERTGGKYILCLTGLPSGFVKYEGTIDSIINDLSDLPEFNAERGMSGEYLRERAIIEAVRLLKKTGGYYVQ